MISRISGTITEKTKDTLAIKTGGISYDVMIPKAVMSALNKEYEVGSELELVTYYYHQVEPSKAFPVLIGFQNSVEKEFFEQFISVSGIGPKAACRALAENFSSIAGAIDAGDTAFLKKLPGIGERKALEIVARLKGKVGKFGLIRDEDVVPSGEHEDIKEEALAVMMQLQYKKTEAVSMIDNAIKRNPNVKTSEEILNEVYKGKVA